ncbi:MAG: arylsulfatase A-like enzyme [Kiritimatiellia bacterium]
MVLAGALPPALGSVVLVLLARRHVARLTPITWASLCVLLALGASVMLTLAHQQAPPLALVALAALSLAAFIGCVLSNKRAWVIATLALLLTPLGFVRLGTPDRTETANVLLVTVDNLRHDAIIDGGTWSRLADRGVRFDRALTPTTRSGPAHTALFTGRGPWDDGLRFDGQPVPSSPTLAEYFQVRGYRTAAFVSSDLVGSILGYNRGFSVYDDDFTWIRGLDRVGVGRVWVTISGAYRPTTRTSLHTTQLARQWLRASTQPWFCWVHLHDATGPYLPPVPFDERHGRGLDRHLHDPRVDRARPHSPEHGTSLDSVQNVDWITARYHGEVAALDAALEPLIEQITQSKIPTIIVLVSTHGEGLGEQERWFRHGGTTAHESIVPMVIVAPELSPGTVPWPVELTDLAPTLMELSKQNKAPSHTGRSLIDSIRTGSPVRPTARTVVWKEGVEAAVRGVRGAWRTSPTESTGWRTTSEGERKQQQPGEALSTLRPSAEDLAKRTKANVQPSLLSEERVRRLGGLPPPHTSAH